MFISLFEVGAQTNEHAISINSYLVKNSVALNEEFEAIVEIKWSGSLQDYIFGDPVVSECHNCEIIGSSAGNIVSGQFKIKRFKYILKPTTLGEAYFGKVGVEYHKEDNSEINTLNTGVLHLTVEPPNEEKSSPLKLTIIVLVLISIFVTVFIFTKKKEFFSKSLKNDIPEENEEQKPNYIDTLKSKRDFTDPKKFYGDITKIIRDFISEKHQINIKGKTTAETKRIMEQKGIESGLIETVTRVMETADNVKFAMTTPEVSIIEKDYKEIMNIIKKAIKEEADEPGDQGSK